MARRRSDPRARGRPRARSRRHGDPAAGVSRPGQLSPDHADRRPRRLHARSLPQDPDRPAVLPEPGEFPGVLHRHRRARHRHRRGRRLVRGAHVDAVQVARLSVGDRVARHALHPLCHGLAVPARPLRPGQRRADGRDGKRPADLQRVFPHRNDRDRRISVVAARVPAAVRGVPVRQCGLRGGGADERRRDPAHPHPRFAADDAAGAARGRGADRGAVARSLRGADARRAFRAGSSS